MVLSFAAVAPEAQRSSRYLSHKNWNYPEAWVLEVLRNNQFDPYNLTQIAHVSGLSSSSTILRVTMRHVWFCHLIPYPT